VSDLVSRSWNDTPISRRASDGYVNATAMCKANGKRWHDYVRYDRSQEYISALAVDLTSAGIPADPIEAVTSGPNDQRGTWVHPRLAVDLARWISPEFAVWMDGWFIDEAQSRNQPAPEAPRYTLTPIETANAALDIIERTANIFDRCGGMDARDQILLKDLARDQLLKVSGGSVPSLAPAPAEQEMSIADAWLQVNGTPMPRKLSGKVGKAIAKLYREEYEMEPPKRLQFIDGAPRLVNSYVSGWLLRAVGVVSPKFLVEAA
jgi:hypothetical protein